MVNLPNPSFLPQTKSPSQTSPFPKRSVPLPWNLPPKNGPSQVLSLQIYFPWPTFQFLWNYPQQMVPLAYFSTPLPSFLPYSNRPSYSVLFLKFLSFPNPWNSSLRNPPSYSATPLRKYFPYPCLMPLRKPPWQRSPLFDSKVPCLYSSFSNSPVNLSPSAKINSQFSPCLRPFSIVPLNLDPSVQATQPFVNWPLVKMPLKVPLAFSTHTPSPWGYESSLKKPSQQSPFLRVRRPLKRLPALKSPLKVDQSDAQNITPCPWGLPRSSHSPSQRPFFSFAPAEQCFCCSCCDCGWSCPMSSQYQ